MDTLPQELLRAIVEEIDDDESLRMCSLVGTIFREHSQRVLLYSLTLGDAEKVHTALWTLLQESPHVARYFRRLNCLLPVATDEVHALCAILGNLSTVRDCYIIGGTDHRLPWSDVPPELSLAIINFLQRQPLAQLHVLAIHALPSSFLTLFLGVAPTLSIADVSADPTATVATLCPSAPSIVQNLLVSLCTGIAEVLSSPEFKPSLANIRKLWCSHSEDETRLISVVAHSLEYIRLQYDEDPSISVVRPLPPLPSLKLFELTVDLDDCDGPWFIARIGSILTTATETLREISVICDSFHSPPPETLAAVDTILTECVAAPRLRWRLDMDDTDSESEISFADDFEISVCGNMPRLLARNKVVVERCSLVDEGFSIWATTHLSF
ncbi:hypothetical protein B0H19DRAFT_1338218 [Mycena capillaripes]|nr:hypothetical protein B0H19DRAFT_1338218 [Mycena capillaripes]